MQQKSKERNSLFGNGFLLLLAVLASMWVYWAYYREPASVPLKIGEVKQLLRDPTVFVQNVRVGRNEIRGDVSTRDPVSPPRGDGVDPPKPIPWRAALRESDPELMSLLDKSVGPGYQIDEDDTGLRGIASILVSTAFLLGMLVVGFLLVRWLAGGSSPFSFGRSRHKMYAEKELKITFADVAGIDEAMAELREVVDFLKKPEKYQALGGRIPKGVLLVGTPGTGKTLLAKAVAGEADVPFFSLSGSDFVEMFVGVGAARVRDLFAQAESRAPCIIFIDELDALGKTRGGSVVGSHDEREQTLNALLVEMDGFESNKGVIIMAATNRPEMLDAALMRPGRFDRTVVVDRPDINGREAILKVHIRNIKLGSDVDLRHVASLTPGSVGADLANLVNEAALMAARNSKEAVGRIEFEEAIERLAVGLERKSRIMKESEKERIAYHEAGHALVACSLPNTDPVHKVSIIPRGVGALGYVLSRPDDDRHLMTKSELESTIQVALGGTIAEELVYGEISNGATSDLEKVSMIARRMVKEFGMSRLGRVFFREGEPAGFLAGALSGEGPRDYSEQTASAIDREVQQIIDVATEEVRAILGSQRKALEAVAKQLIEKEVIDGAELRQYMDQHPALTDHEKNGASPVEHPKETHFP